MGDGHALTLSLAGGFLKEKFDGDIKWAPEQVQPTTEEANYVMVQRVLRHYDQYFTFAEREFLTIFSAFRLPVSKNSWEPVFRKEAGEHCLNKALSRLNT